MRDLIPKDYHLLVVCGAIVLCTVVTMSSLTIIVMRSYRRHFTKNDIPPETCVNRDAKDVATGFMVNFIMLLVAGIVVACLINIISAFVMVASYIAAMTLISWLCDSYARRYKSNGPHH